MGYTTRDTHIHKGDNGEKNTSVQLDIVIRRRVIVQQGARDRYRDNDDDVFGADHFGSDSAVVGGPICRGRDGRGSDTRGTGQPDLVEPGPGCAALYPGGPSVCIWVWVHHHDHAVVPRWTAWVCRSPAKRLFDMDIGGMVGSFLLFAAVDHALVGTVARKWYESDLANGICRARWLEYSWSASLMMVLIASYSGITSFVALINIAAANSAMILFGWLMEASNPPGRETTTWLPFAFGCLAGIFPWIAVWFQVFGASDEIPGFVYGIILSEMFAFACFGLTQLFQYLRLSIWSNYIKGEKTYLILSLVAKSILAWQIYGGSLSDDEDQ